MDAQPVAGDPHLRRGIVRHHLIALGSLLILVGVVMILVGFMYGLSEVKGWPYPVLFGGLAAASLGAALLVWRGIVRVGGHGWITMGVRVPALALLVCLLAAAGYALWWFIGSLTWIEGLGE